MNYHLIVLTPMLTEITVTYEGEDGKTITATQPVSNIRETVFWHDYCGTGKVGVRRWQDVTGKQSWPGSPPLNVDEAWGMTAEIALAVQADARLTVLVCEEEK